VKLNAVSEVLHGKRVVVVDDSLVRGTTSRKIVKMIRQAGAKEVHMRISSPPIISPCFYGIDTPTKKELIASDHSTEEIRKYITADSLAYLSLEGMLKAAPGIPSSTAARVLQSVIPFHSPARKRCNWVYSNRRPETDNDKTVPSRFQKEGTADMQPRSRSRVSVDYPVFFSGDNITGEGS
jgi:glutamine phosphoribosylpyrophosphate amidotransferase